MDGEEAEPTKLTKLRCVVIYDQHDGPLSGDGSVTPEQRVLSTLTALLESRLIFLFL